VRSDLSVLFIDPDQLQQRRQQLRSLNSNGKAIVSGIRYFQRINQSKTVKRLRWSNSFAERYWQCGYADDVI